LEKKIKILINCVLGVYQKTAGKGKPRKAHAPAQKALPLEVKQPAKRQKLATEAASSKSSIFQHL